MLEGKGHLVRGIMVLGDIRPDTIRCPGAMALDVLNGNLRIKGHGGTRMPEKVKCKEVM